MSTLLGMLDNSSNALDVFQQALSVVQNNVNNSSTPGYATQTLNIEAQPMDIAGGMTGGVTTQGLSDSRSTYAEEQVQAAPQALGLYTAPAPGTGTIQNFSNVSATRGLPAHLNTPLSAFSAWSV